MFRTASLNCGAAALFDLNPRGARLGAQEAKVAQVTTRGDGPALAVVLEQLPAVHERLVESLRAAGWPLGPERHVAATLSS